MAGETQTLNFGPEWLRALSSGGTVTSPPLSPALPKYKLADYRYGREEMLALYLKDNKIPSDLMDKEFQPILQEEPLLPLALVPFTEEEQRNFSMSVNSTVVLRLMGRGGGTVVGAPRGRSTSRGRGRGRGEGSFYQRSFDEVESGFGRGTREMHRSQSWEERGDRRFEKPSRKEPDHLPNAYNTSMVPGTVKAGSEQKTGRPTFEECGTVSAGKKHELTRSESDNWRHLKEEVNGREDEDGGIWRPAGTRKEGERWVRPPSPEIIRGPGWREQVERRRRFEFDFRERDDERGHRKVRPGSGSLDEDKDSLPEWCFEDAEEETGTFDSSGAFLPSKKVQKEPIPEEQELDFRPSEDGEERSDSEGSHNEEAKEPDKNVQKEMETIDRLPINKEGTARLNEEPVAPAKEVPPSSPTCWLGTPVEPRMQEQASCILSNKKEEKPTEQIEKWDEKKNSPQISPTGPKKVEEVVLTAVQTVTHSPPDAAAAKTPLSTCAPSRTAAPQASSMPMTGAPGMGNVSNETDDDDGLKHLEQQAEKMVAYLQDSALDDERLAAKIKEYRTKGSSLPQPQEAQQKWFYKDPQGAIQGPFSNQEMAEWCQAGYFTMSLLVRRACDDSFQPLGDLMKLWGRVPFTSGPVPPQLLGEMDLERRSRQQEISTLYHLHHLQYQQFILQQRYAQLLAEQQKTALSSQQQQQLAVLMQQFQTLKMRISEQNLVHPVTRTMSVPDANSVWELQTPALQPTAWEGNSVWDLPADAMPPGPSPEQLQLEKAKAAKLEQERRDKELRAKQQQEKEEMEQKQQEELRKQQEELRQQKEELRRQQEELLKRQQEEEERKRREEEELARRKQLPSSSTWGQQASTAGISASQASLSLAEIQKLEEERERQLQEEQARQQRELMKSLYQHQQQQQQQQKLSGWGNIPKGTGNTKSLLEIQKEEAKQMQKHKQENHTRGNSCVSAAADTTSTIITPSSVQTNVGSSVWGTINTSPTSQWTSDSSSGIWSNVDSKNSNLGFWDDAAKDVGPRNTANRNKSKNNSSLSKNVGGTSRQNKKVEEEEKLLKLFQGMNKVQDGFTQWCEQMLHALNTANNLDVPTFVCFLKEVESAYEVHDYIRAYLGDTPEAKEFGKQFIERRAKQKVNQQRQQPQQKQDSVWGLSHPAVQSVFHSNQSNNQQSSYDTVQSAGKKKKKQRMVRADPSLLGFSVNASSERLNMGEIETLEEC
ncbi:GRB10-interacting GYF protein 2 isoform X3 [Pleurodeles waltl]|uniref:GRB10-interacting GYF protein 2 isoform X3 n=1 Tax=Pleurodeles waltl TaxID=8319 RepID=UPI003709450E